jgi:hypothetical protein
MKLAKEQLERLETITKVKLNSEVLKEKEDEIQLNRTKQVI